MGIETQTNDEENDDYEYEENSKIDWEGELTYALEELDKLRK